MTVRRAWHVRVGLEMGAKAIRDRIGDRGRWNGVALTEADKDNMDKALDNIEKAIKELEHAMKDDDRADTTLIIDSLMEGVEDSIYLKITDAESVAGTENKDIIKAWEKFDEAVTKSEADDHKKAIDLFKEAVKSAENALK